MTKALFSPREILLQHALTRLLGSCELNYDDPLEPGTQKAVDFAHAVLGLRVARQLLAGDFSLFQQLRPDEREALAEALGFPGDADSPGFASRLQVIPPLPQGYTLADALRAYACHLIETTIAPPVTAIRAMRA